MIALYEMLRVARHSVILIEPHDTIVGSAVAMWGEFQNGDIDFRVIIRALLRKTHLLNFIRRLRKVKNTSAEFYKAVFEESGNYVYSISKSEIAKVALGIGLPTLAFAHINDYYEHGVEFEKAVEESPLFIKVKKKIEDMDKKNNVRLLVAAIFKNPPDEKCRKALIEMKYDIYDLPKNPGCH